MKTLLTTLLSALILSACATSTIGSDAVSAADKAKLASIIAARSDEEKARDTSRNPQQTLELFGITSDMAVAEVLPGGGWYTKINYTRLIIPMKPGQCLVFSAKNKSLRERPESPRFLKPSPN